MGGGDSDEYPLENVLDGYALYLGPDLFKEKVCAYYKLDPFKETKPFEHWVKMYMSMLLVEYEDLISVKRPLAELSGEIAGGFFNPEGLKKYYDAKKQEMESRSKKKKGESDSLFQTGSGGGTVVSNTTFFEGNIVDKDTLEPVISMEELANFLKKQSNL